MQVTRHLPDRSQKQSYYSLPFKSTQWSIKTGKEMGRYWVFSSCGNSIGVIFGESLPERQHNNPYLSLSVCGENETETFWKVFLLGFGMMDVWKGEKDIVGVEMLLQSSGIAVDVASCGTRLLGNLRMSREVMPRMMPVRLSTHFHNGCWSSWLSSLREADCKQRLFGWIPCVSNRIKWQTVLNLAIVFLPISPTCCFVLLKIGLV